MDDYRYPHSVLSLPVLAPSSDANPASEAGNRAVAATTSQVASPAAESAQPAGLEPSAIDRKLLEGKVIEALQQIYDPEIPVNIYELGLIYDVTIDADNVVHIKMTLTAPACPVAGSLPGEVEQRVQAIPEVKSADVELVWEPPWSRDRMSEAALLTLGMI